MLQPTKYFKYLNVSNLFSTERTKEILSVNPTIEPQRAEATDVNITVYDYNTEKMEELHFDEVTKCFPYKTNERTTWINIDGLRKSDVESICTHFDIHPLVAEDILSINQRPKMEEAENSIFCLLNMLFYNEKTFSVEQEQISIVLTEKVVISFQEDKVRDVFGTVRERLKLATAKVRQRDADFLCYVLLDSIVDNYFLVMEKIGERIEVVEEEVARGNNSGALSQITQLRKELIVLKRNFSPVRELVNGFLRSESNLIEDRHTKYYKDVYDHIVQAIELLENYRDVTVSLQDLHLNNVNLKMNEVMKVMAIVTCLMAPATVIGGIFGMNFEVIPWLHTPYGFFGAVAAMLLIPLWMLLIFRKRGWF